MIFRLGGRNGGPETVEFLNDFSDIRFRAKNRLDPDPLGPLKALDGLEVERIGHGHDDSLVFLPDGDDHVPLGEGLRHVGRHRFKLQLQGVDLSVLHPHGFGDGFGDPVFGEDLSVEARGSDVERRDGLDGGFLDDRTDASFAPHRAIAFSQGFLGGLSFLDDEIVLFLRNEPRLQKQRGHKGDREALSVDLSNVLYFRMHDPVPVRRNTAVWLIKIPH